MEISLVIPAYNEENRITDTVRSILAFLEEHFETYEVIVVDDGSTDRTVERLRQCDDKHLEILCLGQNQGKGQAIKTGMAAATGRYCFFTDADLPYRLESIRHAMDLFKETDVQLVIGSRDLFKDKPDAPYPLHRKIMSKIFSAYINTVLDLGISDTQCGFKAFTYDAAKSIFPVLSVRGFSFDVELLYVARKYKMGIRSIPVNMRYTEDSKINIIADSLKMVLDTLKVKINDRKGLYEMSHGAAESREG